MELNIDISSLPTAFKKIAKDIEERTKRKRQLDMVYNFSLLETESKDSFITVMEEGIVNNHVGATDELRLVIAKGSIEKFLSELPDDYQGIIKVGHTPIEIDPRFIGTFTKRDFRVVDSNDGRKQLLVKPKWNAKTSGYQDLKEQNIPVGFSPEFEEDRNVRDEEASMRNGVETLTDFYFDKIGIVSATGFASSGNKILFNIEIEKGGEMDDKLDELEKALGITEETEKVDEEVKDEVVEKEQEVEEQVSDETKKESDIDLQNVINDLKLQVAELTAERNALKENEGKILKDLELANKDNLALKESQESLNKRIDNIASFLSSKGIDTNKEPEVKKQEQVEVNPNDPYGIW